MKTSRRVDWQQIAGVHLLILCNRSCGVFAGNFNTWQWWESVLPWNIQISHAKVTTSNDSMVTWRGDGSRSCDSAEKADARAANKTRIINIPGGKNFGTANGLPEVAHRPVLWVSLSGQLDVKRINRQTQAENAKKYSRFSLPFR